MPPRVEAPETQELSDDALHQRWQDAIARWEALADVHEASRRYEEDVFPLACERLRRLRRGATPAQLAFVPVGTQPYSPILASIANPATRTVLLATDGTLAYADETERALESADIRFEQRTIGDGTVGPIITRTLLAEYASEGFPAPGSVVVDLTGGRKATAALLGANAALLGFRQSYVEGQPSRVHPAFFVQERFVELSDVRGLVGHDHRQTAVALLRAGAPRPAADHFHDSASLSGYAALDHSLALAAEGLAAWQELRWQSAARKLRDAARNGPAPPVADFLKRLGRAAGRIHASASRSAARSQDAGDRIRGKTVHGGARNLPPLVLHATGALALDAWTRGDALRAEAIAARGARPDEINKKTLRSALSAARRTALQEGASEQELELHHPAATVEALLQCAGLADLAL